MLGKRDNQQDSARINQKNNRFVATVCDGMGGMNSGQDASCYASEKVISFFSTLEDLDNYYDSCNKFLFELDDLVFGLRGEDGSRLGCGSTAVSVLIENKKLYWFSVGDSKIYLYRNRRMKSLAVEHNYGMELDRKLKSNEITQEEYDAEADKREQLISYLGMGTAEMFDSNSSPYELLKGDVLLLCTDGVYRALSETDILGVLKERVPVEIKCRKIQNMILKKNVANQDNATGIIIQIK